MTTITNKTRLNVTLWAVLAGIATIVGVAVKATILVESMHTEIKLIGSEIEHLRKESYTISMAAENAMRQAIGNPGHRVPDPREPGQFFVVEHGRVTTSP